MIVKIILFLAVAFGAAAVATDPGKYWPVGIGLLVLLIFLPAISSWMSNWDHINRKH